MSQAHDLTQIEASHELIVTDEGHVLESNEVTHVLEEAHLVLPDAGYITSATIDTAVTLTQAEYNLLTPVPTTLYIIIG